MTRLLESIAPSDEDAFILDGRRRGLEGAALEAAADAFAKRYGGMVRKAAWAYGHVARRLGLSAVPSAAFEKEHEAAWSTFLRSAVEADERSSLEPLGIPMALPRTLLLGWHFAEYPGLTGELARRDTLVLVARDVPWMSDLETRDCLLNFRSLPNVRRLAREMSRHRPIYAMFDYCYDETFSEWVSFLSYPSRTPVGILVLARRYGYRICVVSPSNGRVKPLFWIDAAGLDPEYLARLANRSIETAILENPAHWLMWASVDRRWRGVDYSR